MPTGSKSVIVQDPDILSGQPVSVARASLSRPFLTTWRGFLQQYPSVTREQAIAALEEAKALVLARFGK